MDFWTLAQYWLPALAAIVAVVVLVRAAHSRASKAGRQRQGVGWPVDVSYLDSSHIGEPQAPESPRGRAHFDPGVSASARQRRARR
jgi:hypothetical protein